MADYVWVEKHPWVALALIVFLLMLLYQVIFGDHSPSASDDAPVSNPRWQQTCEDDYQSAVASGKATSGHDQHVKECLQALYVLQHQIDNK